MINKECNLWITYFLCSEELVYLYCICGEWHGMFMDL